MADVFISYARVERDEAEAIKARLEAMGLSVFLDIDGLDGGDVFSEKLDREVKSAGCVLGLWSPTSLTRPWVQIECDIGKRRGVLVPVAIKPFTDMQTPAAFWNIQFVDLVDALDDPDHPGWRKLAKSLERTLKRPPRTLAPAIPPPPPPGAATSGPAFEARVANTRHGPRNYVSSRPDTLPRADAAVFYTLVRAAMSRETITLPFLLSETQRLSRSTTNLTQRWLDVAFNRILRAMLAVANERGEVIPFIAAIAVDPETHLPPTSIDSAALAWIDHSYAPEDAANRMAELRADRVRAVARLQNPVFAYTDWADLLPYVGIPPADAETYLAGDGPPMPSSPTDSRAAKPRKAGGSPAAKSGGGLAVGATIAALILAATGAGVWFADPFHWRTIAPSGTPLSQENTGADNLQAAAVRPPDAVESKPSAQTSSETEKNNVAAPASSGANVAALGPVASAPDTVKPNTAAKLSAPSDASAPSQAPAKAATMPAKAKEPLRAVLERTLVHPTEVSFIDWSPDGSKIVTSSADRNLRIWDARSGALLFTLAHTAEVNHAYFTPDGTRVVSTVKDHTARVWNAATGSLSMTLTTTSSQFWGLTFTRDGAHIATYHPDGNSVLLWDGRTGASQGLLLQNNMPANSIDYSPDGTKLLLANSDKTAHVFDIASKTFVTVLAGHTDQVWTASYSPDGARIVTASEDGTARVWNALTGAPLLRLAAGVRSVNTATWSRDGLRIATTSSDSKVRIWDANTGAVLATLEVEGHDGFRNVAFSPDGDQIAASAYSGKVPIWRILPN